VASELKIHWTKTAHGTHGYTLACSDEFYGYKLNSWPTVGLSFVDIQ